MFSLTFMLSRDWLISEDTRYSRAFVIFIVTYFPFSVLTS